MPFIEYNNLQLTLDAKTQEVVIRTGSTVWQSREDSLPYMETQAGRLAFSDAKSVRSETFQSGLGCGIRTIFRDFEAQGSVYPYAFETIWFIEYATGNLFCEWIPLEEAGRELLKVQKVFFPAPFDFGGGTPVHTAADPADENTMWYTLLTQRQGMLIPNGWETPLQALVFNGQYLTAGAYMPWFGQVKERCGYIAISLTPWDGGVQASHAAGEQCTTVGQWLMPSLGRMRYRRILRFSFLDDCDYNDLTKIYRTYVREQGRLVTLRQKEAENPQIRDLIECSFVHTGIKTMVQKDSRFFDPAAPEKNNHLATFASKEEMVEKLHKAGSGRLYLHLDGWAEPGYDNNHPDYYPVCEEAGGAAGMKSLEETLHAHGDLFGIHDQYRDFYERAESFDRNYCIMNEDGTNPGHANWAGGPQSYLCASQAQGYVRRNFFRLFKDGIHPDCAYLDVFTCNDADECFNKEHRMSRRECLEYRASCFSFCRAQGILPSSEEVSDWAVPSLVFCHYAPFQFMMNPPGTPKEGIPVPLFNLVYHDCLVEPWMMDKVSDQEDYMLYAVLCGGAPYLVREPAYPGIDGAFDQQAMPLEDQAKRCNKVSALYRKVAESEMVSHAFVDGDFRRQRVQYANGISVVVDFAQQMYTMSPDS
jgi:hypothetical protein